MSTTSPETSTCKVPSDILRKVVADFVYDNGIIEVAYCMFDGETSDLD